MDSFLLSETSSMDEQSRSHLEERSKLSNQKHERILEEAREAIDTFYGKRKESIQKQISKNRMLEKSFLEERDLLLENTNCANPWESVSSLVDFKQACIGRDSSRMKKILIDLKQQKGK
jgi:hypothetical protein